MFRSFSFFSQPLSPHALSSRFHRCKELEGLHPELEKLRAQVNRLKSAAESQAISSLDYRKNLILSYLLAEIDGKIIAFNQEEQDITRDKDKNKASIIALIKAIAEVIQFTKNKFENTLSQPRDGTKAFLGNTVSTLLYGSAVAGGFLTASPLACCAGLYLANKVEDKTLKLTGLDDQTTTSIRILNEISNVITKIGLNLNLATYWNQTIYVDDFPPEFCCLITHGEVEDPVVCILDGITYERKAITAWLNEHRSSPYNREMMKEGQTIEEVLVTNRTLKNYLDRIREENPTLTDEKYQAYGNTK